MKKVLKSFKRMVTCNEQASKPFKNLQAPSNSSKGKQRKTMGNGDSKVQETGSKCCHCHKNENFCNANVSTTRRNEALGNTRIDLPQTNSGSTQNIHSAGKSTGRSDGKTYQPNREAPVFPSARHQNLPDANVSTTRRNEALGNFGTDLPQTNSRSTRNLSNVPMAATKEPFHVKPYVEPTEVHPDRIFASNQNLIDKTQSSNVVRNRKNTGEFRLFLGGLPDNITETQLKERFSSFGKVTDVIIALDKATNKSKKYGFLEFEEEKAFEICLNCRFVNVKGRNVEVKKAWPRGFSKEERGIKKGRTKKNDSEKESANVKDYEKLTNSSTQSSPESETNLKDNILPYQKIFEDYFKAKFAVQELINSGKVQDSTSNDETKSLLQDKEKELEKWLVGLSLSRTERSCVGDNVDSSSEVDSETDKSEFENDARAQHGLMATFFPDDKQLGCVICQWTPQNNSFEDLFSHCNTPAHRQKLKERFQPDEDPNKNKQTVNQDANQENRRKKRNGRSKSRSRNKLNELSVGNQDNPENKNELKSILEEIMTSIEVKSEKWIRCKICNKNIPPSGDIQVLMRNLSYHLQSRRHLGKIQNLEKSVQEPETKVKAKTDAKMETQNGETEKQQKVEKSIDSRNRNLLVETLSLTQLQSEGLFETKVTLLCLPCNFFSSKPKKFLDHLCTEPHFASLKKKWFSDYPVQNAALENVRKSVTRCTSCERYLFGSLPELEKHFDNCKF